MYGGKSFGCGFCKVGQRQDIMDSKAKERIKDVLREIFFEKQSIETVKEVIRGWCEYFKFVKYEK